MHVFPGYTGASGGREKWDGNLKEQDGWAGYRRWVGGRTEGESNKKDILMGTHFRIREKPGAWESLRSPQG